MIRVPSAPFRAPLAAVLTTSALLFTQLAAADAVAIAPPSSAPSASTPTSASPVETAPAAAPSASSTGAPEAAKPPPPALAFLLRPLAATTSARIDASAYLGNAATTEVSILTAGYRVIPGLTVAGRLGYVHTDPTNGARGDALTNPLLFALFAPAIDKSFKLALFLGATLPIGMGGGDNPDMSARTAISNGIYTRQAMDNALFAVNYFTATAGVGLGYVLEGWTFQADATVLYSDRVRGACTGKPSAACDLDDTRTNFTAGLSVGYRVYGPITLQAEGHSQVWLSTPLAVGKDPTKREQFTAGLGVRGDFAIGGGMLLRPGVGFFLPIDDPMAADKAKVLLVDFPVIF